jgi:hypothetical protein
MITIKGPQGLRLILDRKKVIVNDPGQDTPQIVELAGAMATLACAIGEGELDAGWRGVKRLSPVQSQWLLDVETAANDWTYDLREDAVKEILKVKGTNGYQES